MCSLIFAHFQEFLSKTEKISYDFIGYRYLRCFPVGMKNDDLLFRDLKSHLPESVAATISEFN